MYSTILVPIDLSHKGQGEAAIALAKQLTKDSHASIILLNVMPYLPSYIIPEIPAGYPENFQKKTEEDLKAIAARHGLPPETQCKILQGNPYQEILQFAEDIKADLIVIGSHQPGWGDFLIGSVAAKVVKHAKCSVLVQR